MWLTSLTVRPIEGRETGKQCLPRNVMWGGHRHRAGCTGAWPGVAKGHTPQWAKPQLLQSEKCGCRAQWGTRACLQCGWHHWPQDPLKGGKPVSSAFLGLWCGVARGTGPAARAHGPAWQMVAPFILTMIAPFILTMVAPFILTMVAPFILTMTSTQGAGNWFRRFAMKSWQGQEAGTLPSQAKQIFCWAHGRTHSHTPLLDHHR